MLNGHLTAENRLTVKYWFNQPKGFLFLFKKKRKKTPFNATPTTHTLNVTSAIIKYI